MNDVDPTKWDSPLDAYRFWHNLSITCEKEMLAFKSGYLVQPHLAKRSIAERKQMLRSDGRYKLLVDDVVDCRGIAAFWANAVQIDLLTKLLGHS